MNNLGIKINTVIVGCLLSLAAVAQSNNLPKKVTPQGAFLSQKDHWVLLKRPGAENLSLGLTSGKLKSPLKFQRGGVNGGGGDVIRSTPQEVKSYLETVRFINDHGESRTYGFMLDLQKALEEIDMIQNDGELLPVPQKNLIQQLSVQRLKLISPTPFSLSAANPVAKYDLGKFGIELKLDGPCLHDGQEKDGSFSKSTGKICLSVPRLTAYSPEILPVIVAPLFIHEMLHESGYGENEAVAVQSYFERALNESCKISVDPIGAEGAWINIEMKSSHYVEFSMRDNGFYGQGNEIALATGLGNPSLLKTWFVSRYVDRRSGKPSISNADAMKIHWNADRSGELLFTAFDVSGGRAVPVRNRLVWSPPSATGQNFGGYSSRLEVGTSVTVNGKVLSPSANDAASRVLFYGNCF